MIDFVDTTAASLAEYWNNGEGWGAHREADKPKSFNVESVDCQLQGSAPPQKSTTVTNFVPTVGPIYTCPTKLRQPITLDFGKKTFAIKARRISGQWTKPGGSAGASEIGAHMMMFSAPTWRLYCGVNP